MDTLMTSVPEHAPAPQPAPRRNPAAFKPGQSGNPAGRPKGIQSKVTRGIKEAIEMACAPGGCHPEGLAGWLIERARSESVQDRQIFAGLVAKALPAQLQASVQHGGVVVQLGWLAGRSVGRNGTPTSQAEVIDVQAIDSQGQSALALRVSNPEGEPMATNPTPHPPQNPAAGGPGE